MSTGLSQTPDSPSPLPASPQPAAPATPASQPEGEPTLAQDLAAASAAGEPESHQGESAAPETPPTEGEPAGASEGGRALLEFVETLPNGKAVTGKYKSDFDFIHGALNAMSLVGRRDSDAEIGKMIRERPAEALAFLQQQTPRAAAPQPAGAPHGKADDGPPDWKPEYKYLIEQDPQTGQLKAKPGAPPDIVERARRAAEYMEAKLNAMVYHPEEFLKPYLEPLVQQVQQQIQQQVGGQLTNVQEGAAIRQWYEGNKQWLFVNGDPSQGETAHGHRLAEHVNFLSAKFTSANPRDLLGLALDRMQAENSRAGQARPAGAAARTKPNVAVPARTEADEDALVQNETLEQSLRRHMLARAPRR